MRSGGIFEWLGRRPSQASDADLASLPVDRIDPSPFQPRRTLDQSELEDLAASIRQVGVLQPVVVRPRGDRYELVMGERRWRAAQAAGLRTVPALVRQLSDADVAVAALVENLQRADLSFWDEAAAYARIIDTFGLTQEQLAASIGRSQSAVANKLRLLRLPEEVRSRARSAGLGERHVRALLRLPDEETQLEALQEIIDGDLSAREAEELVDQLLGNGGEAPEDETAAREPDTVSERPRARRAHLPVIKDVRIMLNTFRQGVEALRKVGLKAELRTLERDDHIEVTIRIPKG